MHVSLFDTLALFFCFFSVIVQAIPVSRERSVVQLDALVKSEIAGYSTHHQLATKKKPTPPKPAPKSAAKPTPAPKPIPKSPPSPPVNSAPIVWPTPKIPYPTGFFYGCFLDIECDEEGAEDPLVARGFVVEIEQASVPTPTSPPKIALGVNRRDIRTFKPKIGSQIMTILNLDYPVAPLLYQGNGQSLDKHILGYKVPGDNIDNLVVVDKKTALTNYADFVTQHIVELQTVKIFLEYVVPKDKTLVLFFHTFWKQSLNAQDVSQRPNQPDNGIGFPPQANLNDMVFQALGSDGNRKDFVLCDKTINAYKARIWKKNAPLQAGAFNTLVANGVKGSLPTNQYFTVLRNAIGVFKYMNVPSVKQRMQRSVKNVETELKNLKHYKQAVDLAPIWIAFMKEHIESKDFNRDRTTQAAVRPAQLKALESNKSKRDAHKKKQAALEKDLDTKIDSLEKKLQSEETKIRTLTTAKALVLSKLRAVPKSKPAEKKKLQADNQTKKEQLSIAKKQHRNTQIALSDAERAWAVLYSAGVDGVVKSLDLDKKRLAMYKKEVAKMKMPPVV